MIEFITMLIKCKIKNDHKINVSASKCLRCKQPCKNKYTQGVP